MKSPLTMFDASVLTHLYQSLYLIVFEFRTPPEFQSDRITFCQVCEEIFFSDDKIVCMLPRFLKVSQLYRYISIGHCQRFFIIALTFELFLIDLLDLFRNLPDGRSRWRILPPICDIFEQFLELQMRYSNQKSRPIIRCLSWE